MNNLKVGTHTHDDDDFYGEEDFELESQGSRSNKLSPMKQTEEMRKSKEELHTQFSNASIKEATEAGNDEEDEEEGEQELSGDLEKYIMEMQINPSLVNEDAGVDLRNAIQQLDGIKPSHENLDHQQMGDKLGFSSRPLTHLIPGDEINDLRETTERNVNISKNNNKNSISPTSKNHYNQIPPNYHSNRQQQQQQDEEEEDDEEKHVNEKDKVESLLMELFPEKYNQPKQKNAKKKKAGGSSKYQQLKGLSAQQRPSILSNHYDEEDSDRENDADPTKNVLSGLENQLKLLKNQLKVKDEKIMKLTEHSVMMANHMDKLKGEVRNH
jgi:hypothetical protein